MKARFAASFLVPAMALCAAAAVRTAVAQDWPPPRASAQVAFHFERPGLAVPEFLLEVKEDGSAHYTAEQVYSSTGSPSDPVPGTQHVERALEISPATTRRIFTAARELNRFNDGCASTAKNIADTGRKTLRYTGEGGEGTCTYNYAQDKRVVQLTEIFLAIAATLDLGRKLAFDHRFDRLGLDADIARLVQESDAGRAIELDTIAPTLRSIAEDAELLERVRARAARLLQQVHTQNQTQTAPAAQNQSRQPPGF